MAVSKAIKKLTCCEHEDIDVSKVERGFRNWDVVVGFDMTVDRLMWSVQILEKAPIFWISSHPRKSHPHESGRSQECLPSPLAGRNLRCSEPCASEILYSRQAAARISHRNCDADSSRNRPHGAISTHCWTKAWTRGFDYQESVSCGLFPKFEVLPAKKECELMIRYKTSHSEAKSSATFYEHYELWIDMLNKTAGTCLR